MNKAYIYTIILLVTLALAGCRQTKGTEDLTDAQKLEVLDLKIERNPKDANLLAERARLLLNLHRLNEAQFDITKAIDIEPKNEQYRLLQADIYFAGGDIKNSYSTLGEAESLAPDSKEVQLKMGEITFYSRDYERSLRHLTKVTEQEPDNRTALFMKGYIYKEQGDTANAIVLMRRVCDIYPDYEPPFEELGILYASRLDPMALEYLSTAMRLEPSNTNAIYAMAMYYQNIGELDEAEKYYHMILDINPDNAEVWHNLGYIAAFYRDDYDKAIECFDKALLADPNHEAAATNRSIAIALKTTK